MSDTPKARIFISYSRKDGAAFAAALRKRLEAENLSVWQDLSEMEGGRDWWSQIEDAILADGRLVSGSDDRTIRLWDLKTGTVTATLEGHNRGVTALCPLADGRLASASDDRTIRFWHIYTGVETAQLKGHNREVTALCVLPDGRLASGSDDNTIRLWDAMTGAETARLEADAPIRCLAALPLGSLVAGDAIGRLHRLEIVD